MHIVTALRYQRPMTSAGDLNYSCKVTHKCNDSDSALQVVRDLVAIAENDRDAKDCYGYAVSVAYFPQGHPLEGK